MGIAPIDLKARAERKLRRLLDDAGLPPPDEVQYGEACVRFLWHDRKVAVVVDLDEFEERDTHGDYDPEELEM